MKSHCVECYALKEDPDEFSDGLRCTECYERGLAENEGTPPGVDSENHDLIIGLDREGLRQDVEKSGRCRYVPRGGGRRFDLIHPGRPQERDMSLRQLAFLARNPGHEAREQQQAYALITKYMPMRYGWTK